jgi:hypothetical protein
VCHCQRALEGRRSPGINAYKYSSLADAATSHQSARSSRMGPYEISVAVIVVTGCAKALQKLFVKKLSGKMARRSHFPAVRPSSNLKLTRASQAQQ